MLIILELILLEGITMAEVPKDAPNKTNGGKSVLFTRETYAKWLEANGQSGNNIINDPEEARFIAIAEYEYRNKAARYRRLANLALNIFEIIGYGNDENFAPHINSILAQKSIREELGALWHLVRKGKLPQDYYDYYQLLNLANGLPSDSLYENLMGRLNEDITRHTANADEKGKAAGARYEDMNKQRQLIRGASFKRTPTGSAITHSKLPDANHTLTFMNPQSEK